MFRLQEYLISVNLKTACQWTTHYGKQTAVILLNCRFRVIDLPL